MSPDGTQIVFSSPRSGNGDIYQVNRDGGSLRRLTDSTKFESEPMFSPDGAIIAFTREFDGRRHIWLMDKDGKNQRQLTFGDVLEDLFSFSPDGSELVIARSPLPTGLGRSSECFAIKLRDEKPLVRKLEGRFSEYSPNGKNIAYFKYNQPKDRFEIWIMDSEGSNQRFLATGSGPDFSPDGTVILYTPKSDSPGSLWMSMTIDGKNQCELGQMQSPVFSADGKHIVYLSPEYRREIWRMDADGTNRERLDIPTGYVEGLQRCPGGFILRLIVSDGDDRVGDIYLINTENWSLEHVTSMR